MVKEYVGAEGEPRAELLAALDERTRRSELELRAAERREREDLDAFDAEIGAACEAVELAACAALVEAGYRLHKRGEWRLRRGGTGPGRGEDRRAAEEA